MQFYCLFSVQIAHFFTIQPKWSSYCQMYLKLQESFLARRDAECSARLPSLSPKEVFQPCSQIFRGHLQFKPFCCAVLPAVPSLCQNQIKSKAEKFIANYFIYLS